MGQRVDGRRYEGLFASDGRVHVTMQSDEERAHHYVPHGINVKFTFGIGFGDVAGPPVPQGTMVKKVSAPEQGPDTLGVPILAPNYDFGISGPVYSNTTQPTLNSGLRTIASVRAVNRVYEITLSGIERIGSATAYHLQLQPVTEPDRHRLRELWIDTQSYAVLKAVTLGNFTRGPSLAVPWEITYQQIGGVEYIDSERALSPLKYGYGKTYDEASISFREIAPVKGLEPLALSIGNPDSRYALTEPAE
jgi:hypothetical protein